MAIILITGGARSGKSVRAESRARGYPGQPIYIATAEALDAEMSERIALHRARRANAWIEREVPLALVEALDATDGGGARLVDCLTLWLSNLMHANRDWSKESSRLANALGSQRSPVVLVTNEVGLRHRAGQRAGASLSRRVGSHESDDRESRRRGRIRRGGIAYAPKIAPGAVRLNLDLPRRRARRRRDDQAASGTADQSRSAGRAPVAVRAPAQALRGSCRHARR